MITKPIKKLINSVRTHYNKQYTDVVDYILKAEPDELDERMHNVEFLIETEPYFVEIIKWLKSNIATAEKEEEFKERVEEAKPTHEYFFDFCKEQTKLVEEKLLRLEKQPASTLGEINRKQREIAKYNKKLEQLQQTQTALTNLKQQLEPAKRPVGRPKKTQ